jgi:SAM-dependent methyltransferase
MVEAKSMNELPHFTAFNIKLRDGSQTQPNNKVLFEDTQLFQSVARTFKAYFPDPKNVRIADLGCLEGGYAIGLAKDRYREVLGIDVRQENIDKCNYAAKGKRLDNLKFVKDDVRNVEKYGQFDAVFCGGLLYHLDYPKKTIKSLSKVTKKMLILNTHYALAEDPLYDEPQTRKSMLTRLNKKPDSKINFYLSQLTKHEGLRGRWYKEFEEGATEEDMGKDTWASFGNKSSFWIVKEDLLQALKDAGFKIIYEQYDFIDKLSKDDYIRQNDRSIFVCIK